MNAKTLCVVLVAHSLAAEETLSKRIGNYEISLRPPVAGIVAGEEIQIEFRITDATQVDPVLGPSPVVRARIETTIDMPVMPGMPKLIEVAHPEGVPGEYGIHPTLAHGGDYRLKLNVFPPAAGPFEAEFSFKAQDAGSGSRRNPPPPRFRVEVASDPKNPKAGEVTKLRFTVRERDNPRTPFSEFEVVHEKLMHLVVVSKDLAQFSHEHPKIMPDGTFTLDYRFRTPGEHHLFADVAPKGAGANVLFSKIKVTGKATSPVRHIPLALRTQVDATSVEIAPPEHPMETNKTKLVSVSFRNAADGEPVLDLENYLGAKAHLILIREDATTFVHSHPDERQTDAGVSGIVPFLVRLPKPGVYRAWLQFIRASVLHTAELELKGAGK